MLTKLWSVRLLLTKKEYKKQLKQQLIITTKHQKTITHITKKKLQLHNKQKHNYTKN